MLADNDQGDEAYGSSNNLNNKNTEQPVVVNNIPISWTDTHKFA